jgi:hypothetical protein
MNTCVVLASGPSLTTEQVDHVRRAVGIKSIVVNSTYETFPEADVLYGGDFLWWKANYLDVRKHFKGECWTQDRTSADRYGLRWVKGVNRDGLSLKDFIHLNGNSGMQAVNLAYLWGFRRILLLGFDMRLGPKGEKHWHADHPAPLVQAQVFSEWVHKGAKLAAGLKAAGCEVINCTPGSAWRDFPESTIEKELS